MKMKKMFLAAFMTAALMCGNTLFAQSSSYLNLGLNIPQGEFGSKAATCALLSPVSTQGGAGLGANLGFKFITDTKAKGLGIMFTIDGMYNGLQKDVEAEGLSFIAIPEIAGLELKTKNPSYINMPIMVGLNYCYNITNTFGLFAEGGVGANVRFALPCTMSAQGQVLVFSSDFTSKIHYTPKVAFAYQFGGGVMISKAITLGVNYYNLGASPVSGHADSSLKTSIISQAVTSSTEFTHKDLSTSMLIVRLGIRLQ